MEEKEIQMRKSCAWDMIGNWLVAKAIIHMEWHLNMSTIIKSSDTYEIMQVINTDRLKNT